MAVRGAPTTPACPAPAAACCTCRRARACRVRLTAPPLPPPSLQEPGAINAREGEHVVGVAHIFASFNDTFVVRGASAGAKRREGAAARHHLAISAANYNKRRHRSPDDP